MYIASKLNASRPISPSQPPRGPLERFAPRPPNNISELPKSFFPNIYMFEHARCCVYTLHEINTVEEMRARREGNFCCVREHEHSTCYAIDLVLYLYVWNWNRLVDWHRRSCTTYSRISCRMNCVHVRARLYRFSFDRKVCANNIYVCVCASEYVLYEMRGLCSEIYFQYKWTDAETRWRDYICVYNMRNIKKKYHCRNQERLL